MKKWLWVIIVILAVIILVNPLWRPVESIRAHVLRRVPLGTSMAEAEEKIYYWTSWEIRWIDQDSGYERLDRGPSGGESRYVGVKSMRVYLGGYKIPLCTCDVVADFGFDENGKLIDVAVNKEYDSL